MSNKAQMNKSRADYAIKRGIADAEERIEKEKIDLINNQKKIYRLKIFFGILFTVISLFIIIGSYVNITPTKKYSHFIFIILIIITLLKQLYLIESTKLLYSIGLVVNAILILIIIHFSTKYGFFKVKKY